MPLSNGCSNARRCKRALHVVKTSDGASWAARQVAELVRSGLEVHVALPRAKGDTMSLWKQSGAELHVADLDFPATAPWRLAGVCRAARSLVSEVRPDIIHSHFFGTTLVLRHALGRCHQTPRIFQVAGPLHLEHLPYRTWDLRSAGPMDSWIASSRCIAELYGSFGVGPGKVFTSYYGFETSGISTERRGLLRTSFGISSDQLVVGNINLMYAPKYYLGQTVGLKCHEDVIDALGIVISERPDVVGVLVGGPFGLAAGYERRLRARARLVAGGRIKMPGILPHDKVRDAWADFDCAVHVPLSENCGGVVEPLLAGVPTIASSVGGLTEVVQQAITGVVVPARRPTALASAILAVLDNLSEQRRMAMFGRSLVQTMFDVVRTSAEIQKIYQHILDSDLPRPSEFDPFRFTRERSWMESVGHAGICAQGTG